MKVRVNNDRTYTVDLTEEEALALEVFLDRATNLLPCGSMGYNEAEILYWELP